jgi:hypothetical protein
MSSYPEGQAHQLMKRLEAEGFTPDDVTKLGQYKNLSDIRGLFRGTHELRIVKHVIAGPLLDAVGTVNIATTEKFVASEKFVCGKSKVKISYLGNNFTEWFLGEDGKVEAPIGEQTLRYARLKESSVDEPIITEIGGEEKAETTLMEMFSLMEEQRDGEVGVLLNNGYANIFYIRDKNAALRAVGVYWHEGGWDVDALSVADPRGWNDGRQVFFRIPVAA